MTVPFAPTLLETLSRFGLLEPGQVQQLRAHRDCLDDARTLARVLVTRDWLTPYQANLVLQGREAELFLGPYLVLERLGEGGAGQVFKARHQRMKRLVALKLIRRELLTDGEVVQRFLREIHVVSQLAHPNVVHAYDAGPLGSTYFLAMECVEGTDLFQLVRNQGPLPIAQACDYLRQAALGLQHAHERGLVHRDVKPPNFLVAQRGRPAEESGTRWGVVKLLDLGLARLQRPLDGERTSMLTSTGPVMMGTPDYLAPEQAIDFHAVDIRADIYGLGCTAYYLLTGEPPFPGGTLAQKLLRHQQGECLAVEQRRSDVPPPLADLLRRMLAKQPEDRPQTPCEIADALDMFGEGSVLSVAAPPATKDERTLATSRPVSPSPAIPPLHDDSAFDHPIRPRQGGKRGRLLLASILLVTGLTLGAVLLQFNPSSPSRPSEPVAAATTPTLKTSLGWSERVALPPGSRRESDPRVKTSLEWPELAAAWNDPKIDREQLRFELLRYLRAEPGSAQATQAAVWLRQMRSPLDRLSPLPADKRPGVLPPETVAIFSDSRVGAGSEPSCVAFSPDGQWLVQGGEEGKIRLWRLGGSGDPLVLHNHRGAVRGLVFAPDGQSLATFAANEPALLVWDLSGTFPRERAQLTSHTKPVRGLAISPDGKTLASASMDGTIRLWDLSRKGCPERSQLRGNTEGVLAVAFSADGKTLASSNSDQTIRLWDLTQGADQPARVSLPGHQPDKLAFAATGKILAGVGGFAADRSISVWDASGQAPRLLWSHGKNRNVLSLALSADGRLLASSFFNGEVGVFNTTTGHPWHQWEKLRGVHSLDFAADGRHLAIPYGNGIVAVLRLPNLPVKK